MKELFEKFRIEFDRGIELKKQFENYFFDVLHYTKGKDNRLLNVKLAIFLTNECKTIYERAFLLHYYAVLVANQDVLTMLQIKIQIERNLKTAKQVREN